MLVERPLTLTLSPGERGQEPVLVLIENVYIRIIRFWNNDIFEHLEAVVDVILREVEP